MNQLDNDLATWVIRQLDNSKGGSIEYNNHVWLKNNVNKKHIVVTIESIRVNIFEVVRKYCMEGSILVQNGEEIKSKETFRPEHEALLLTKLIYSKGYIAYLYLP